MKAEDFFSRSWEEYVKIAPAARTIYDAIEGRFGEVQNDHVAFRTVDRSPIALTDLEAAFLDWGYTRDQPYTFVEKHLRAYGYLPPRQDLPLVFLSELVTAELSDEARAWIDEAITQAHFPLSPAQNLLLGRPWELPSYERYQALQKESDYLAWLSVWGLCANHFTIAVHHLLDSPPLLDVVSTVRENGYRLNQEGGLIKGSPADLLEQASTLAEEVDVEFAEGIRKVPSCYYEFALRHRLENGRYFQGFVAASANDIFESTTAQKGEFDTLSHSPARKDPR